jgi:hypothetical protein
MFSGLDIGLLVLVNRVAYCLEVLLVAEKSKNPSPNYVIISQNAIVETIVGLLAQRMVTAAPTVNLP